MLATTFKACERRNVDELRDNKTASAEEYELKTAITIESDASETEFAGD